MSDLAHKADVKVTIYLRKQNDKKGYIAAYTTYPKCEGEDWNRGHDLSDGEYSEETLNRVIDDLKQLI